MRIYFKNYYIKNFNFLHLKYISHLGHFIPNMLLHPIWEIGPNLVTGV